MESKYEEETKNPKKSFRKGGKEDENGLTRKKKMGDAVDELTKMEGRAGKREKAEMGKSRRNHRNGNSIQ